MKEKEIMEEKSQKRKRRKKEHTFESSFGKRKSFSFDKEEKSKNIWVGIWRKVAWLLSPVGSEKKNKRKEKKRNRERDKLEKRRKEKKQHEGQ